MQRKEVIWAGDALLVLQGFPAAIQHELGYNLGLLQIGSMPLHAKPFKTAGAGCWELRAKDESGAYRAIYVRIVRDKIHVLHCFQKKTEKTSRHDVQKAAARYQALRRARSEEDDDPQ
jgi:phage-related protein